MSIVLRIGAVRGNSYSADNLCSGQDATSSDTDAHDIPVPEEVYHRPTQTYPGCFGLPYQDHNYGAPPPLSPTPPKSPPTPAVPKVNGGVEVAEEGKVPTVSKEEEVVEDSVTRCICGFLHDDGYMICCDKCSVWQHIDCMEIDRNNIPESYCCEVCEPRTLDFDRAKMIQLRKREEIDTSATDTDPEEPANALASLGRKPVQPKPKGSKQRRVSKAGARLLKTGRLAKSQQLKREKKLKLTKKEKENMKDLKKQKVAKSGVPKQKKLKKKLNTSLTQTQNKAEFWSSLSGPFCSVEEAKENEYSPEILEFLSHAKTNGIHSPHSIGVFPEELLVRLYQVSDIKKNRKGLEATDLIVPGRAVIEFKGKVMLRQHYQHNPLLNQSQPYVLYYSKFEGLDLCIDASAFGGDARFIRRSCTPNAEMCHIIDNGNLHFIVQAKKEIAKGSEITIPFDFSYQDSPTCVECACGRANCPVAKFWKKVKLAPKSPEKPKRKRQASGEGRVRRNSQSKNSPIKGPKSPVKSTPLKSPAAVAPLLLSLDEPVVSVDSAAAADSQSSISPPLKPAPIPRRSSRATSDVKEERDVKPSKTSHSKESAGKAVAVQEDIHVVDVQSSAAESSAQPVSESETDTPGECPRKLTREERKMEAIMKAFEKMAKREERRKEALARLDKKHVDVKDEPVDKGHSAETGTGSSSESGAEKASEQQQTPPPAVNSQPPEVEAQVVVKVEDPPPTLDSPHKSARHRRMKRKRRSSRVMSALEPLYSSPSQPRVTVEPLLSGGEEMKEEPVDLPPITSHSAPSTASPDFDITFSDTAADSSYSYVFHKKKKYLFSDWSGSRGAEGRSDPLMEHGGEEEMFVSYTPSPRNAMEHIQRRNSTSASYGRAVDSSGGFAKKRWLRQAMFETPTRVETVTSPPPPSTSTGSSSPAHPSISIPAATVAATATAPTPASLPSPTGSPSDFVTPLKKRRLAPEFLPSMSSAAQAILLMSSEPSGPTTPPVTSELSATSTVSTPAGGDAGRPPSEDRKMPCGKEEERPLMKATRLFGRKNRNGFVGSTDGKTSICDVPGSSAWPAAPATGSVATNSRLEELSMDGLSSSSSLRMLGLAGAGSMASATTRNSADSAEASECSSGSPGPLASSSSMVCVVNNDSGVEMPLVDSSGAALDADLPEAAHQRLRGSDSVSVCSSDNEASTPCVHSADSDLRAERMSRQDVLVVAESSSVSATSWSRPLQDQDGDVSESQPSEDRMEVEDEGNEASGSVSGTEELGGRSRNVCSTISQPAADCQVNSSQDCPWSGRLGAVSCSPSQAEAECNNSSESLPVVDRTCDSRQVSVGSSERGGVSSALDNSLGDRERSGVSSAQDSSPVSSAIFMRDSESLASSDMECGPSSSTQALARVRDEGAEDMVCNSSDVTGSEVIHRVCEENNVDSTTQSGRVLRSAANQCDTADSHSQAAENGESCCDSNSDEQAQPAAPGDGANVSSSGPADSQSNEAADSGLGGVSAGSSVVSSSASVSSSLFSCTHTDSALGMQVSSMLATTSSSALSTTTAEAADLPDPSPSTSGASPSVSNSLPGVDSASVDPSVLLVSSAAAAPDADGRELDGVGTSDLSAAERNGIQCVAAEQCEASTSSAHSWRLSDDGDSPSRQVFGRLLQSHGEGDLPVSSVAAGLDAHGEGLVVNGDLAHGGLVSSFSEDSSGSSSATTPCAAVSSSEAQAAPAAKRKVSLSEYRNRRKEKTGCAASTSSSTSPKSSSDGQTPSRRVALDSSISLAPLPLFEPITISRESRDHKEQEKREKPMSLSDRLRIEFGLETASEEEEKATSTGLRKPSNDIPPPPPLPPNGVLGGVGVRRLGTKGQRGGTTENEDEGRPAPTSSLMGKPPSATATATTGLGVTAYAPSSSSISPSPAPGPQPTQGPGYTWLAKLHSGRAAAAGVAGPAPPHQLPSSSAAFAAGVSQPHHQRSQSPYSGPAAGGPHLPNGSHSQAPATFSTGSLYPAPQGQPQPFAAAVNQQQAPPPPPPPTTAYSPYVAQSRTRSLLPQTSPLGPGQQNPRGRSGSVPQTRRPAAASASMGSRAGRVRHTSADPSSSHPHGRFHFEHCSHNQTLKHKGSFGPDRNRH